MPKPEFAYIVWGHKPHRTPILARHGDRVFVTIPDGDATYVNQNEVFKDRASACLSAATHLRKYARSDRESSRKYEASALEKEDMAIAMLAEASKLMREKVQHDD